MGPRDMEPLFKKQPGEVGLAVRSQSRPWEMLVPETRRGLSSGRELSPPVNRGADSVSCRGVTPFLQSQYLDTETPPDKL